jgi:hypothetical protein
MWKIKMAFRPGSVDLVEAPGTAHLAIDDPRFFGNIDPDIDFPDLEDVAFSQHTLSTYAQRRATLAPEHHTVLADSEFSSRILARRDEPSLDIPDVIPGEEFFRPRASEASKRSRISEIEVMRGRASSISAIHPRPSFASDSSQAARGRFDDDIPAFEELGQDEMMAFGEDAPPPMDAEYYGEIGYIPEMEGTPPGEENQQPAAAGLVLDDSVVFGIRRGTGTKGGRLAEDLAEEEEKKTEGAVQKKKKPLKRGIKVPVLFVLSRTN